MEGQMSVIRSHTETKGNVNLAAAAAAGSPVVMGSGGDEGRVTGGLPAGTFRRLRLLLISLQHREYCGGTCPNM